MGKRDETAAAGFARSLLTRLSLPLANAGWMTDGELGELENRLRTYADELASELRRRQYPVHTVGAEQVMADFDRVTALTGSRADVESYIETSETPRVPRRD